MTGKEIENLKNKNPRFKDGIPCKLTKEQKQLHKELYCREMINSCLCYGQDFLNSEYKDSYIEELGKERVIELYNEQKEDFSKAKVLYNVHEDSEGCSYNSIIWADELEENIENEIDICE